MFVLVNKTVIKKVWHRFAALIQRIPLRRSGIAVGVIVFGVVGMVVLKSSHAATPTASTEAENGVMSNGAVSIGDSAASNNQAVKFGSVVSAAGFVHPGILVDRAQLDFVKAKLALPGSNTWKSALAYTQTAKGDVVAPATTGQIYGSLSYVPHPVATVDCVNNNPGCLAMLSDSTAAYTDALNYYYSTASNRAQYAQLAINILNDWATTTTSWNGSQAQLEIGWVSDTFSRAAEIIRYTYVPLGGQETLNVAAITTMLNSVFKPAIQNGAVSPNGNWELAMADGMVSIGVFTDNRTTFNKGLSLWRARVPAYIYETSDNGGNGKPIPPPGGTYTDQNIRCFWLGSGSPPASCNAPAGLSYENGQSQETCRDLSHVGLGLSMVTNAAETATIQGVDLFREQKQRIADGYEYAAAYTLNYVNTASWPLNPCSGKPGQFGQASAQAGDGTGGIGYKLGWEIAYNELSGRLGMSMPNTLQFITQVERPSAYKAYTSVDWEQLTNAAN